MKQSPRWTQLLCAVSVMLMSASTLKAEIKLPAIIGDSMVIQRDKPVHLWGWADAGQDVKVELKGKTYTAKADDSGKWTITGDKLSASFEPIEIKITAGSETKTLKDILVGEVWLCSGQSNMQWSINSSVDGDLATLAADNPHIRLITVPNKAAQEPKYTFEGSWKSASPQTIPGFSAVGYFFGKKLFETIDVPVGLINNAWGGSAAEAWTTEKTLLSAPSTEGIVKGWKDRVAQYEAQKAELEAKKELTKEEKQQLSNIVGRGLQGNHRPANLYNGCLSPVIGYPIRGVIWYQGESNAGRAYQYRDLFPMMISEWRNDWNDQDISFYWVQLADYMGVKDQPSDSAWAEVREAQTMTAKLPKTGEAVIIDLGTGSDIHPPNKEDVASRLLRHALAKDYGLNVVASSPTLKSHTIGEDGKVTLVFDHDGGGKGLKAMDFKEVLGFTIAGEDKKFYKAEAVITGKDTIVVSSPDVKAPKAVRYAWADNPICNVYSAVNLPMTPFRTDDWEGITAKSLGP
jgi:sialate O-acetylesterase